MHGSRDDIIPFRHGQWLYEAAPEPKAFLWVPDAGHNDFTWVSGDRLKQAVVSFQQLLPSEIIEQHSDASESI